jgi:hypothetical protein
MYNEIIIFNLGHDISILFLGRIYYLNTDTMVNLSDITSKIRTIAMFIIVDL